MENRIRVKVTYFDPDTGTDKLLEATIPVNKYEQFIEELQAFDYKIKDIKTEEE